MRRVYLSLLLIAIILLPYCYCLIQNEEELSDTFQNPFLKENNYISPIDTITVDIDVNLMLLGLDKYSEDFTSIQDGIMDKLSDQMVQRFIQVHGHTIQENEGSHISYKIHYHYLQVHPMVQVYLNHLFKSIYRDIDINLTNIKVINPYELSSAFNDLFDYIRQHSDLEVPNENDLVFIIMNSQLDIKGRYGFSTEFSYSEEQKMIDEIFKDNSPFAISEFVFPLTEPLSYSEELDEQVPKVELFQEHGIKTHKEDHVTGKHNETYCIYDYRQLSLLWAYERDKILMDPSSPNARNSPQFRVNRNLELLRDFYDKKEQKRILIQMKQILNNDYLMNDELLNWIEGTYIVSDYFFIQNYLLFDISANTFEWGSIHDDSNIRLKSTFVDKQLYLQELQYFTTCQESLLNYILYLQMLISRSCKKMNQPSCTQDKELLKEIQNLFQTKEITAITDIQNYYNQLLSLETNYFNPEIKASAVLDLSRGELEISIQLTQILTDMISHFVIPPYLLDHSFTTSSFPHTIKEYTSLGLNHNHGDILHSHSYYARFDESKVHSLQTTSSIMKEIEHSIHLIPETKQKIHFQVNYFTHSEFEDYFDVDGGFFDYNIFRSEVEKLKLPSQEFYFSFQEFKLEKEPRLQLALLQSMNTIIIPHINNKRQVYPVQQKYINTTLLYSFLEGDSNSVTNNDIQIYIFCISDTTRKPIFLDEYEQVVVRSKNSNHMIFAVQNELLSFNSPYSFNHLPLYYNLHNIMSPLLTRVFELLSSTKLNLFYGESIQTTESPLIEDCVFRWLGSVDTFFSANILYSPFHLEIIHKSKSLIHLQNIIEEMNHYIGYFNSNLNSTTNAQREAVQIYYQQFLQLLEKCEEVDSIQETDRFIQQADVLIGKIKWVWMLVLHEQVESCKSHVAEIQYMHVFSRSLVLGTIVAIICTIFIQKSKKKVKEL